MDSNLLKEAIADAKAVRQTALANAKVALEEAFSERYHAMFADKLKEDADQGNFQANSNDTLDKSVDEEENINGKEIDELIKELESEVGLDAPQTDQPVSGDASSANDDTSGMSDVPPSTDTATPIPAGYKAAPDAIVPIESSPDASIPPAVPGATDTATPPTPPSSNTDMDEDINLDELLENLKEEINAEKEEEEEEEEGKTIDEDKKLSSSAIGGKTGGSDNKKPSASASSTSKIESAGVDRDGYPDGDAKTIAKDATTASRPNQGKNVTSTSLSTPSAGGTSGPALKATRPNSKGDFENTARLTEENESLKTQLNEAEIAIKYVKGQLNEINLLNAKLLYTNKLFKEYNMNNSQKMRIVEMFDLSKNVREVRLTYANLAESLNFGGIDVKRKNAPASNANVRSITEGLASKPIGSTKPTKDIISESKSAMVSKFQKLAGIKNK